MNSPKYNRTMHMPFSPGSTNDDKIAESVDSLLNKNIVITEKMDGSNTSLEADGCFARTHAGPPSHRSFDMLKSFYSSIKMKIPQNLQLFGEYCFAQHSIFYNDLPGYFLLFGVRELDIGTLNTWASWAEVEMWAEELGVPTVPILFKGEIKTESELKNMINVFMSQPSVYGKVREGVVVRVQSGFTDENFSKCVMKYVRANHVQTSEHWKDQAIIKNKLKE